MSAQVKIIVQMPTELRDALDVEAKRTMRDRSSVVRALLRHGLGLCASECMLCAKERL
jgi:metal-responsive CopG/Arc/MetJ family transcriptional regulator